MTFYDSYYPKIDKNAFSVRHSFDETDNKAYWLSCSPEERLRHVEFLRRINYGKKATAQLQKVLEIATGSE